MPSGAAATYDYLQHQPLQMITSYSKKQMQHGIGPASGRIVTDPSSCSKLT
jgi:hypothetical protein